MTRQRMIPSINYRSANLIRSTFPVMPNISKIKIAGAARLNDAYGSAAGVNGFGTVDMFEVGSGLTYTSPGVLARKVQNPEESTRGRTVMIYDPDDFATPVNNAASYIPGDDFATFIRLIPFFKSNSSYGSPGPILIVPPYDFFSTEKPTFTVTAIAPNLGLGGTFPTHIPDFLGPLGAMNFLAPGYCSTFSITNCDGTNPLFFSFHPGMPPSVLLPKEDVTMTGSGIPEFFVAAPNANPWFSVRMSVVNGS